MNKMLDRHELEAVTPQPAIPTRKRKALFLALASGIALAGGGFGIYETTVAARHVSTDNAYVDAESAQVTALTSGPVAEIRVVDTQAVKKGDVLVVLDDTDRRLELEQAESALGQI
jgi:membrane fusion protein (multidrug efflux system)